MKLDEAVILITGGSSGLGAACVDKLAEHGARIVIADISPPRDGIPAERAGNVLFAPTDVTNEDQVRAAIAAGEQQFGPLRGVVTCAGILHAERVVGRNGTHALDAFRRVIEINLVGTFNAVRLSAEAIARAEPEADNLRGVAVMTSSVAAFEGQVGQAAYSASKGGVAALTLPLAREFGQLGIRVVSIAPGVFETPMMQAAPEKVRQSLVEQIPFPHRFGNPQEFAALVCHVFENNMLNGCVLRLDGATRMGAK